MKALKEKYPQIPSISEAQDSYWEESYDYYNDYYGDCYEDDDDYNYDYYDGEKWYSYAYIEDIDKFTISTQRIKNYSDYGEAGYEVYIDFDENIHTVVYTHSSPKKLDAFFGCVLKTVQFSDNPSDKIKKIYNKLSDEYPEIYIKLVGRFE